MPRFSPDACQVQATTPIYDKGDYIIEITNYAPFAYSGDVRDNNGKPTGEKKDVYGCRYSAKLVGKFGKDGSFDDELNGEDVSSIRMYWHNDASRASTKRFFMAALGYDRNSEAEFNEDFWNDTDFSIDCDDDYENVTAGESWQAPVSKLVRVSLDKEIYNGNEQQKFGYFDLANQKK